MLATILLLFLVVKGGDSLNTATVGSSEDVLVFDGASTVGSVAVGGVVTSVVVESPSVDPSNAPPAQEVKTVTRKEQLMLIVHHEDFKIDNDTYIELYAVKGTGRSTMKAIRTTFLMHRLLQLKKKSMMNRGCS